MTKRELNKKAIHKLFKVEGYKMDDEIPVGYCGILMAEFAKEVAKNNDNINSVSESNFNTAIKHIENSYCDAHLNTPYMLLGDVTELIKILTGKEVDWRELAKHSR